MSNTDKDLTPDEEWLLLGFQKAAEKRSKKPLQDRFLKWVRKEVGLLLKDRNQNAEAVQTQTNDSFREFLFRNYFCPIFDLIGPNPNWTQIGERVGAHGVTIQRWLESNPDPKLSTLSMVFAAQDATFRNGHAIAADGYVYAFDALCRQLDRPTSSDEPLSSIDVCDVTITDDNQPLFPQELIEETLVLYRVFREEDFWQALDDENLKALDDAAVKIADQVESIYPCRKNWNLVEIRKTLKKRAYEWSVMEAALPYEWF